MYPGLFEKLSVVAPNLSKLGVISVESFLGGSMHYGAIRLAVYSGLKVAKAPLNIQSYILMHTIGNVFAEGVKASSLSKKISLFHQFCPAFYLKLSIHVFDVVTNAVDADAHMLGDALIS